MKPVGVPLTSTEGATNPVTVPLMVAFGIYTLLPLPVTETDLAPEVFSSPESTQPLVETLALPVAEPLVVLRET